MRDVERLARLDTGALSDALDRLGLAGAVSRIRPLTGAYKIAGRVVTVKFVAAEGRTSKRHFATAAIEASGPGDVLVIEHRSRKDRAGWGGILSRAAKARGIAGTLVDGLVRDVDESRDIGYPVFARGLSIRGTKKDEGAPGSLRAPIVLADATVEPGDLVVGDADGVVVVAREKATEVLEKAREREAREAEIAERLRKGETTLDIYGWKS